MVFWPFFGTCQVKPRFEEIFFVTFLSVTSLGHIPMYVKLTVNEFDNGLNLN